MSNSPDELTERLLDAALVHVPFEGWSEATLRAATRDAEVGGAEARAVLPRGAVDLALAHHRRGDARMVERLKAGGLDDLRFRDKIAAAVRYRIEAVDDREAARRATTLFALPQHTADGARAIWNTVDLIWTTLGDKSDDANWYTKRATLAGVYASTVLYWLGDDSLGQQDTWGYLDRRIDDVMRIEKLKGAVNDNPLLRPLMVGPNWLMRRIKPPQRARTDLPGGAPTEPPGE